MEKFLVGLGWLVDWLNNKANFGIFKTNLGCFRECGPNRSATAAAADEAAAAAAAAAAEAAAAAASAAAALLLHCDDSPMPMLVPVLYRYYSYDCAILLPNGYVTCYNVVMQMHDCRRSKAVVCSKLVARCCSMRIQI